MNKEEQVDRLAFFLKHVQVINVILNITDHKHTMKIIIFGGTGFVGRELVKSFLQDGFKVFVVSRNLQKAQDIFGGEVNVIQWDTKSRNVFNEYFTGQYAILNLAGENIGAKLWTKKQKVKILDSRVKTTNLISEIINRCVEKPVVFMQASATGYYGTDEELEFNETSPKGEGFLADVCIHWENALNLEDTKNTRIIVIRTGVVLDKSEGLIAKMKFAFRLFFGGHFGNGKQWISWIHIDDEVRAIRFLLSNNQSHGIYNLSAPKPERMRKFCKIFGAIQFRLSWFHIPTFVLDLLPGKMGEELFLSSQKVIPVRLEEAGFEFRFKKLEDALRDLLIEKNNG